MADHHEGKPDGNKDAGGHRCENGVGGEHGVNQPLEAAGLVDAGGQRHGKAELYKCGPGKIRAYVLERAHAYAGAEHEEDRDKNNVVGRDMVYSVGAESQKGEHKVQRRLFFLHAQRAHGLELFLCEGDVHIPLFAFFAAEKKMSEQGDDKNDDSGGDARWP